MKRMAQAAEAIHDVLGEHRDSTLMQQSLRDSVGHVQNAFELGILHEVERAESSATLADYPGALRELKAQGRAV